MTLEEQLKQQIQAEARASVQNQGLNINPDTIKKSKTVACECGGVIFSEKVFFKVLSPLISPSGREEIAPAQIMVCERCGQVPDVFDNQGFLPDEMKSKTQFIGETFTSDPTSKLIL